jgi:hypothetical protein
MLAVGTLQMLVYRRYLCDDTVSDTFGLLVLDCSVHQLVRVSASSCSTTVFMLGTSSCCRSNTAQLTVCADMHACGACVL